MRADDLPTEVGLQLRMIAALALAGLLVLALAAGMLAGLYVSWELTAFAIGVTLWGAFSLASSARLRKAVPGGDDRLTRAVGRVALVADVPAPACVVVRDRVPLSWTLASPRSRPSIHVSTGMLERLADRELEAVAAHELAHILHRDAVVMTVLAGPPAAIFAGLRAMFHSSGRGPVAALFLSLALGPPAVLLLLVSRIVSRHRELAADRAAALLVGSPAAVAAALAAVDAGLTRQRPRDLRRVHARDAFHFVPAREARKLARLWATHPRTRDRIERMERLEAGLQR